MEDTILIINQIANVITISLERFEIILNNEHSTTKLSARWVSRFLTPDHKLTSLIISQQNLTLFARDPTGFFEGFITQAECWIHHFDQRQSDNPFSGISSPSLLQSRSRSFHLQRSWWLQYFGDAKDTVFIEYLQFEKTMTSY